MQTTICQLSTHKDPDEKEKCERDKQHDISNVSNYLFYRSRNEFFCFFFDKLINNEKKTVVLYRKPENILENNQIIHFFWKTQQKIETDIVHIKIQFHNIEIDHNND